MSPEVHVSRAREVGFLLVAGKVGATVRSALVVVLASQVLDKRRAGRA